MSATLASPRRRVRSPALRRNLTLAIAAAALWMVGRDGQMRQLWNAMSPGLVAIFVWFAVTSVISPSPGLALNRLVLAGVVIVIAFCLPLLQARVGRPKTKLQVKFSATPGTTMTRSATMMGTATPPKSFITAFQPKPTASTGSRPGAGPPIC